jgi:hypothetical protein
MIKNCRSAVPAIGIALLIVGAAPSHAQIAPGHRLQGSADQSDPCTGAGVAAKAAVCRAAGDATRSKYNLLYADDVPETEDTPSSGEDAPFDRPAGHTPKDASRGGLRSGAAAS